MKTSLVYLALGSLLIQVQAGALSSSWVNWPANATGGITYETITTTALTTYCPEATVLTHGGVTYTITEATTLTITDCPCTVTRPIHTLTPKTLLYTSCPPTSTPSSPPNNPNNNNVSPALQATQTGVYTQTVTDKNGAQVTVTGTRNAGSAQQSGSGNGNGGNGQGANGTMFTGGAARVGAGAMLGLGALVVLVL